MEEGWLIELVDAGREAPLWFMVQGGDFTWTSDASQALRFSRMQDAAAMAEYPFFAGVSVAITDHAWGV